MMGLSIAPRSKGLGDHMPRPSFPWGGRGSVTEGLPVVKQSGQGAEQLRNRSPLPGTKDLKCVLSPRVFAALSLALAGDHSRMVGS